MGIRNKVKVGKLHNEDLVFHFKIGNLDDPNDVDEIIIDYSAGPDTDPIITNIPAKPHTGK